MDTRKCKVFWARMRHEHTQEFYQIYLNLYFDAKEKKNADSIMYSWGTGAFITMQFQTHFEKGRWVEPYNTGTAIQPRGNSEDVREGLGAISRFLATCGWDGWHPSRNFMDTVKLLKSRKFAEVTQDIHWHSSKPAGEFKGGTYYCLEYRKDDGKIVNAGWCYLPESASLQQVQAEVIADCVRRLNLAENSYVRDNIIAEIAEASRPDLSVQLYPHYDLFPFYTLDMILKELNLTLDPAPVASEEPATVQEDV